MITPQRLGFKVLLVFGVILGLTFIISLASMMKYSMEQSGGETTLIAPDDSLSASPDLFRSSIGSTGSYGIDIFPPFIGGRVSLSADRSLIHTASLSLIVSDLSQAVSSAKTLASAAGGFTESSSTTELTTGTTVANMTLRVPSTAFEATLASVKNLALHVSDETQTATDTSDELVDIAARLKSLKALETQYLELLDAADSVEDTLKVTQELASVRAQIEQLEAQQENINGQVAFSTITLSLSSEGTPSGAWQPGLQAQQAWAALLLGFQALANILIITVVSLPLFIAWILITLVAIRLGMYAVTWLRTTLFKSK